MVVNKYNSSLAESFRAFEQSVDKGCINLKTMQFKTGKLAEHIAISRLYGTKVSHLEKIQDFFLSLFSQKYCNAKTCALENFPKFAEKYRVKHLKGPNEFAQEFFKKEVGKRCQEAIRAGETITKEKVQSYKHEVRNFLNSLPEEVKEKLIQPEQEVDSFYYDIADVLIYNREELRHARPERKKRERAAREEVKVKAQERSLTNRTIVETSARERAEKWQRAKERREEQRLAPLNSVVINLDTANFILNEVQTNALPNQQNQLAVSLLNTLAQIEGKEAVITQNDLLQAKNPNESSIETMTATTQKEIDELKARLESEKAKLEKRAQSDVRPNVTKKALLSQSLHKTIEDITAMQAALNKQNTLAEQLKDSSQDLIAIKEGIKATEAELKKLIKQREQIKSDLTKL